MNIIEWVKDFFKRIPQPKFILEDTPIVTTEPEVEKTEVPVPVSVLLEKKKPAVKKKKAAVKKPRKTKGKSK